MNARLARMALAAGPALLATLAVSGCSFFSTQPDAQIVRDVHTAAPHGMLMDSAESNLTPLGFSCRYRQGEYEDEAGATRSAPHFLLCERRPPAFSFNCENRDHVVVLPSAAGTVDDVEVSRGPSCSQP